jgi:hypothetical protein
MDDSQRILENLLEHLEISPAEKDNLVCPVCLDLLKRPVTFSSCGHICCEQCASSLQEKKCPSCRQPFQQLVPAYNLGNIINMSPVKCVCGNKIPLHNIKTHLATCPSAKVFCPYECGELIVRSQLKTHQEQCPYRSVLCECSQRVPFLLLQVTKWNCKLTKSFSILLFWFWWHSITDSQRTRMSIWKDMSILS